MKWDISFTSLEQIAGDNWSIKKDGQFMNYLWSSNNMIMTDRNCSKFKKFIAKILMDNPISIFCIQ